MNIINEEFRTNELAVGKIIGTHGLDGAVKIIYYCDNLQDFFRCQNQIRISSENIYKSIEVKADNGKSLICYIDNNNNVDDVKKYLNQEVFMLSKLFNVSSIEVLDFTVIYQNNIFGKILDCGDYGSGDTVSILDGSQMLEIYLFNNEYFQNIDFKNKTIELIKDYKDIS